MNDSSIFTFSLYSSRMPSSLWKAAFTASWRTIKPSFITDNSPCSFCSKNIPGHFLYVLAFHPIKSLKFLLFSFIACIVPCWRNVGWCDIVNSCVWFVYFTLTLKNSVVTSSRWRGICLARKTSRLKSDEYGWSLSQGDFLNFTKFSPNKSKVWMENMSWRLHYITDVRHAVHALLCLLGSGMYPYSFIGQSLYICIWNQTILRFKMGQFQDIYMWVYKTHVVIDHHYSNRSNAKQSKLGSIFNGLLIIISLLWKWILDQLCKLISTRWLFSLTYISKTTPTFSAWISWIYYFIHVFSRIWSPIEVLTSTVDARACIWNYMPENHALGQLLLTWFNFDPSMDK